MQSVRWATLGVSSFCLIFSALLAATDRITEPKTTIKLSPNSAPLPQPTASSANTPKVLVYKTVLPDGSARFSDQRPVGQAFELLRFDCFACAPNSSIDWQKTPLFKQRFARLINQAAAEHQLESALIRAVIHAESAFNPNAISAKGAMGLMQLMPATMQQFQVLNGHEPEQNIRAGSQYLGQLLKDYQGDLTLALAAYNAGPGNVKRYNGIPPFAETQAYIERVQILRRRYAAD
ncbi:lytic transglycosylase domain-containing protein [Rheinheimera sp. UJ51]|uniref:lytic transglycosylase domain-containing protein n=1 Tax=Rheinheimera sp. UJ51 TaxID=2892446 RepID=UPI001E406735|nr:lytic transglycosylase domain-containing protein [Rheinheimera sp. UJ51]MCC5450992.1 lytic transglycosylase domain-containing protein [Rheinheimera sp. UJ51]